MSTTTSIAVARSGRTAILCPECRIGRLERIQPAFIVNPVFDYDSARNEPTDSEIRHEGESYIGCTNCDFMGMPQDILDMRNKPNISDRYSAYEITIPLSHPVTKSPVWTLSGVIWTEGTRDSHEIYEVIATFSERLLAEKMLYRLTGIKATADQNYYEVR